MSKVETLFNKASNWLGSLLEVEPSEPQKTTEEKVVEQPAESLPAQEEQPPISAAHKEEKQEKKKEVENKEELLGSIIATLSKVIEYKDDTVGKKLIVWLECDRAKYANYDTDVYRNQVLSALVNERGYCFDEVFFSNGTPDKNLRATEIGDTHLEYLQIVDTEILKEVKSAKAVISVFGESGSLLQEQYVLSSNDMRQKMIPAYNIGSGKFPKIPSGYRENHIAIDDNPASPMAEKNKYVSRMHAHIGYSDKFGFYLQVEKDGTRLMGKRTRIFRGEEKIECDNPQAKVTLQSGDLIELGKAVVLRFMEITE